LKDLGDVHYFLGIEVKNMQDGLLVTQEKYTLDILEKVGMTKCKAMNTPMETSEKLSTHEGILLMLKIPQGTGVMLVLYNT
jgi:histone deacetylase 1/2